MNHVKDVYAQLQQTILTLTQREEHIKTEITNRRNEIIALEAELEGVQKSLERNKGGTSLLFTLNEGGIMLVQGEHPENLATQSQVLTPQLVQQAQQAAQGINQQPQAAPPQQPPVQQNQLPSPIQNQNPAMQVVQGPLGNNPQDVNEFQGPQQTQQPPAVPPGQNNYQDGSQQIQRQSYNPPPQNQN